MAVAGADYLVVTSGCRVLLSELEWKFSASGGPGGQHANTANTRAEVRFDIESSDSLRPAQRARLLERLGSSVRVVADDERSQARNRRLALDRLAERLAAGLYVEAPRHATKPSRSAKAARVDDKKRRSSTKQLRSRPDLEGNDQ